MGRRKLPPAEKRTLGIARLFNQREVQKVRRAARKRGKKPATYVREAAVDRADEDLADS